jgi:hypothetical protein
VGARLLYLLLRTRGLFLSLAANHVPDILVNYFLTGSLDVGEGAAVGIF